MAKEETVYMVGESKTEMNNAITKVYGDFYLAFEIEPETGRIVDTDCSHTLQLTKDFIRRMFLGKRIEADAETIEAEVKRRYFGAAAKAITAAYQDALRHFQEFKEGLEE